MKTNLNLTPRTVWKVDATQMKPVPFHSTRDKADRFLPSLSGEEISGTHLDRSLLLDVKELDKAFLVPVIFTLHPFQLKSPLLH